MSEEFEKAFGPQGHDPMPEWWYRLHAAAEVLDDLMCTANASDVRQIADNLLDPYAAYVKQCQENGVLHCSRESWESGAGQVAALTDTEIECLWHDACLKRLDLDDSAIPEFARAIESKVVARCRAEGGVTCNEEVIPFQRWSKESEILSNPGELAQGDALDAALDDMPTWVVMVRPGMVPVRKGPFHDKKHIEDMLRDLYALHADCQCIVIDMPNECYPNSGIEWIDIYGDKRRKPIRSAIATSTSKGEG